MIKFDVLNRFTNAVQFTAEIECDEGVPSSVKLGLALKWGFKNSINLCGANLRGANLCGANLYGASLDDANLYGANLRGANLHGATLCGANLHGANLDDASLHGANLRGANLVGASLRGASLDGASLHGASLLDCGVPHRWRVVVIPHDDGVRIGAGCRWFTFGQAKTHWQNRTDRPFMLPLLTYIEAIVKIKGWKL